MTTHFDTRAVANRMIPPGSAAARVFPRDVEAAALHLHVHIEDCERLTPAYVDAWTHKRLGWRQSEESERPLRGCLVAHRGKGIIFLDRAETPAERRFTLAHELSHFLGHYLALRERATAQLGAAIIEVLDGVRSASDEERVASVLTHCHLGIFKDALARDGGGLLTREAERMESEADAAAFEALAPAQMVVAFCRKHGVEALSSAIASALIDNFGLAAEDAQNYAPTIKSRLRPDGGVFVSQLRRAAEIQKEPAKDDKSLEVDDGEQS